VPPSGTMPAHSAEQAASPSPARGPWAKTGMARARLAGLSFGAPSPPQVGSWCSCAFYVYVFVGLEAQSCHFWLQHGLSQTAGLEAHVVRLRLLIFNW